MKKYIFPQASGGLRYKNDDFIDVFQNEPYKAKVAILKGLYGNGPFIIQGCNPTVVGSTLSISAGFVFINGDIMEVPAKTGLSNPCYISEAAPTFLQRIFKNFISNNALVTRKGVSANSPTMGSQWLKLNGTGVIEDSEGGTTAGNGGGGSNTGGSITTLTPITAAYILGLDTSALLTEECLFDYVTGPTFGDFLKGLRDYVCAINPDPSVPVYENTQIFAGGIATGFAGATVENDNIPIKTPAQVLAFFNGTGLPNTEGVNQFTVPVGVTKVQFELFGGGGAENEAGNRQFQFAFIMKNDGTHYFFAQGGEDINNGMGGESSCPVAESGVNGTVGIGGSGNLGLNGTNPSTPTDIGGGEGGYGRVTLSTTPGDIYYIWSYNDVNGFGDNTNNISKVIIKY